MEPGVLQLDYDHHQNQCPKTTKIVYILYHRSVFLLVILLRVKKEIISSLVLLDIVVTLSNCIILKIKITLSNLNI